MIYDAAMGRQWLDPKFTFSSPKMLLPISQLWPADLIEAHEVSTLVNAPDNDSAACIQPLTNQSSKSQLSLL